MWAVLIFSDGGRDSGYLNERPRSAFTLLIPRSLLIRVISLCAAARGDAGERGRADAYGKRTRGRTRVDVKNA